MHRFRWLLLVLLVGCDGEAVTLVVDLRTDLVPGIDFDSVELDVADGPSVRRAITYDPAYTTGIRIGEWSELEARDGRQLEIRLTYQGALAASRSMIVDNRVDLAVTVVITRSCVGIVCDEGTCVGGLCQDERCLSGEEAECAPAACSGDASCPAPAGDCAAAQCVAGLCLDNPALPCGSGEYCDPDLGCTPLEDLPSDGFLWVGQSAESVTLSSIATDASGAVVVSGTWRGSFSWPDNPTMAGPSGSGFVVGLAPHGADLWIYDVTSTSGVRIDDVAGTSTGRSYAIGFGTGETTAGGSLHDFGSRQEPFVLSLESDGSLLDFIPLPASGANAQGRGIGTDGVRVAVAGIYGADLEIGGTAMPSLGDDAGFGGLLDELSTAAFAHFFGGNANTGMNTADVFGGRACFGGRIEGDGAFPGGTVTGGSAVRTSALIACYDLDGTFAWASVIASAGNDSALDVDILEDGSVVVAGYIGGAASVDGVPVPSVDAGLHDAFVAVFETSGALRWLASGGGHDQDRFTAIATTPSESVIVVVGRTVGGEFGGATVPEGAMIWHLDAATGAEVRPVVSLAGSVRLDGVAWSQPLRRFLVGGTASGPVTFGAVTITPAVEAAFVLDVP